MTPWLTLIGVGAAGIADLPPSTRARLAAAHTVIGSERLLAGLEAAVPPPTPSPSLPTRGRVPAGGLGKAVPDPPALKEEGNARPGERCLRTVIPWQPSLPAMLAQLEARRGTPTVVLATGDPLWFGLGATLAKHLAAAEFEIIPGPSAFQLAAARQRWPLQHVAKLSLHGRSAAAIQPHLLPGNRILALTSDRKTLGEVAAILAARGYGESLLTVLENLGAPDERITAVTANALEPTAFGDFHVLAIDCVAGADAALLPPLPGLPDDAFRHDGQLTKRDVRASTLARLAPYPGGLLWDVGAGCGSVAIEWLRAARDARAIAFERDLGRRAFIAENALALGTPGLAIVPGAAPASLAGHPAPDAVFIGGDVANAALFDACWAALKPGGRLVANAVTLDGEAALYVREAQHGGTLTRLDIATLDRLGSERVLRPRLAVTQWAVTKNS